MSALSTDIQVSFCITCMGRLKHLRETLPLNLLNNQQTPSVEFVILDYSSPDGLRNWVDSALKTHLCTGRVAYYYAAGFQHFHMAHAKNIAHRLARGEIVCNLDADNFTGLGFAEYLIGVFSMRHHILVRSPTGKNGTRGRIALLKTDFEAIGGYDERMEFGWGFEDRDLIRRAARAGFEQHFIPIDSPFLTAIKHDNFERTKSCKIQRKQESARRHKSISSASIERREFVANRGKQWGRFA